MPQTTARIKKAGKRFEIIVDLDDAMKFRKSETSEIFPEGDKIFTDSKKGHKASPDDLQEAFGTEDINEIAKKIVKEGEVLTTQDYRDAEQEKKIKQLVNFLSVNAIDPQTGNPISEERIKNSLEEARINLKNLPIENQVKEIIDELNKIMPIKLQMKKVKITVPAIYTGKAYGLVNQYKIKEDWLGNGDLQAILEIPAGVIMEIYDKLNSMTHGSILSEEIKE
ncbi:ribosome assembly factor SBDS [Candidatus Pacearchaeota archaeon]|nr:ribosome assembly factor SBDS [Candidatus Pacearchaeota archaeon]